MHYLSFKLLEEIIISLWKGNGNESKPVDDLVFKSIDYAQCTSIMQTAVSFHDLSNWFPSITLKKSVKGSPWKLVTRNELWFPWSIKRLNDTNTNCFTLRKDNQGGVQKITNIGQWRWPWWNIISKVACLNSWNLFHATVPSWL